MGVEDAEKKNIARLDFKIDDAITKLNKVDERLKQIAESSESYANTISKNLKKGLEVSSFIDTNKVKESSNQVVTITKKMQEDAIKEDKILRRHLIEQNNEANNKIAIKNAETANKQILNNERVAKSTESLYDKITQYAKTYIIYQGFNELKRAVSETIDEMVEVEQQMVAIDRVLNESSLNLDNYRDRLIRLAYDYGNTFNNVADITLRLAQAGFDSNESIALTEKTLLALNTAELNATQATDDMVAVMAQWGYMTGSASEKAAKYGEIIDKINKVADNYPTTSSDLMDALKKVSSAFNLAGASIDETIATIVAAEKASQRGGKVIGTALSNIVQQIKAEGKLNLAEQLGLDFYEDEAKTKFKPIMEIFQEMSNRMQSLKDAGKESSVEMQQLLELFTVFRRNIGASLLGEMSGEDSTYFNVLKTSINSVGYSLQENEKYMKTAKAAQAQFNAELLKLKTQVWDNGLENVFRDMLMFGTDLINNISKLIDKFGILPSTIGLAVTAYTAINKKMQLFSFDSKTNSIQLNGFMKVVKDGTQDIVKLNNIVTTCSNTNANLGTRLKNNIVNFKDNAKAVTQYGTSLALGTAKTIAMQVATVALNAAISMGLSLAITALTTELGNCLNAQDKFLENSKKIQNESSNKADSYLNERTQLEYLQKQYEELVKKDNRTIEEDEKIYELQTQINSLIKDSGIKVDLVNEKITAQGKRVLEVNDQYDAQIQKIKEIAREEKVNEVEALRRAAEQANAQKVPYLQKWTNKFTSDLSGETREINNALKGIGINLDEVYSKLINSEDILKGNNSWTDIISTATFEEQLSLLTDWQNKLEATGDYSSKTYTTITSMLETLNERQKNANEATEKYNDALSELYSQSYNLTSYRTALGAIFETYGKDETVKNMIASLESLNKQFEDGEITTTEYFNKLKQNIGDINSDVEGMQAIFAETTRYISLSLEDIQNNFEEGEISFNEYIQSLADTNSGLLELYANENNLHYVQGEGWLNANNQIDEYANNLQRVQEKALSFVDTLQLLADNYDYLAAHADEAGNIAFDSASVTDTAYQNLANNFANSVYSMRDSNEEAFSSILDSVYRVVGDEAAELANSNGYLNKVFASNNKALSAAINEASRQSQQAAKDLATNSGNLISTLGKAIEQFNYNIKFETTGGINPGGNILDLIKGKTFKPTSDLQLKIKGNATGSSADLAKSLQNWGSSFSDYISSSSKLAALSTLDTIKPYVSTRGSGNNYSSSKPSGGSGKSSGGSSGGSSGRNTRDTSAADAEKAAQEAQKAEEEAYKNRLNTFKNYITEVERLETRWVKKQKELGQLSNKDYLYITQQRIERYKKYLDEVKKATWMNEEDRLALEKSYSEKIEDLQLDYLNYLKDKLNDEIKAIKDTNSKKIDLIKEEAEARINSLRKVESENDRIRKKEEYKDKRKEALEEISYWEQRTGREAQERLLEARKKLADLDKDWEDTVEDWNLDNQIKAIEDERDAQIKATEAAQEAEIKGIEKVYDEKVKKFAETGEIIYEGSTIQSKKLYNQYKTNFIDPIANDLKKLNKAETKTTTSTTKSQPQAQKKEQQYETYSIKRGDTLSAIARRYGTTVDKIMAANPYIKNKNLIYAGKTLQIPKFHEGGIVGGNTEGYALLQPHEVVLKTEWANSLNRMMKYFDNVSSGNSRGSSLGSQIAVKGNLINIEANIKDKSDADYLTKKIERTLKEKFNIKK